MKELNFKTAVFEGPLDLMLSLIAKHKLDIMDIEISILLEQFLLYIEMLQESDIEVAGEFLEMAARLIYIKSASLLPKHEVEELKKELQGALVEYALCKKAAEKLKQGYIGADVFVRKPAEIETDSTYNRLHDVNKLKNLLYSIWGKGKFKSAEPPSMKPIVAYKFVSIFSKIVYILRRLKSCEIIPMQELFMGQKRSEQIAIFLAILELSKFGRLNFSDDGNYIEFVKK